LNAQNLRQNKEFYLMMKKILSIGILIAFLSLTPIPAFAVGSGGFENASFSAKELSMAGAVTATPDEPAAISYNPAGIVDLPGIQVQADANFIGMWTFKDNENTGSTRSSGTLSFVPTGYITINPGKVFDNRIAFGLGSDSPFGLMNKYHSSDPAAHYGGWKNWLKMYTLKPTMALKITDKISIGGGPMWYRIFDFGAIQGYPNNLATLPYDVTTPDGQARANMSGNHWGWQLGTLIKLSEKHRLGYYFRSPVVVKTSGLVKVENADFSGIGQAGLHHFETGIHTKVALPMNMTWAYAYQPTKKTHYEADFTWSHWSTNKNLRLSTGPTGSTIDDQILTAMGQTASNDKDWHDGYGIQVGASHKLTNKLTLRGGSFFYFTPVPQKHFTESVPDGNHLAISLGLGYDLTRYLTTDIVYYNAFYFTRSINNDVGENPYLLNSSQDGRYSSYMQSFTISMTLHWDDIFDKSSKKESKEAFIEMKPATV
jgi:long-chain fatty acid transport protein